MSIKTTHSVTRDFAIKVILSKLDDLSDEQLSNVLEEVIHNGFYNFTIVNSTENETYYLDYLNNLPGYNDAW